MPGSTLTHTQKARRLAIAGSLLLSLLLIAISFVWWTDKQASSPPQSSLATGSNLRIERSGFANISLQKHSDEQWRIVEPCDLPANQKRLQPLLQSLAPATFSYASSEVDLEAAGLITPDVTLYLNEQRLALGATDLSGQQRYLQRGERVEFVPEWVVPLVNGGLSALAVLDVFPGGLDAVPVLAPSSSNDVGLDQSSEALARWQSLTAQQIVSWPLPDNETATNSLALQATSAGQALALTLYDFERFAAIRFENSACAFIIARSSLPDRIFP